MTVRYEIVQVDNKLFKGFSEKCLSVNVLGQK